MKLTPQGNIVQKKSSTSQLTLRTLSTKIIDVPLKYYIFGIIILLVAGLSVQYFTSTKFKDYLCSQEHPSYIYKAKSDQEIKEHYVNLEKNNPNRYTPEQISIFKVSAYSFNNVGDREYSEGRWSISAKKCIQNDWRRYSPRRKYNHSK